MAIRGVQIGDLRGLFGLLSFLTIVGSSSTAQCSELDDTPVAATKVRMTDGPKLLGEAGFTSGRSIISSDGSRVVTCTAGGGLDVWDGESGRPLLQIRNHERYSFGGGLTADAPFKRILTAGAIRHRTMEEQQAEPSSSFYRGSVASGWDAASGQEIRGMKMSELNLPVNVAIKPDGLTAACMDTELNVKIWDLTDPGKVRLIRSITRPERDLKRRHKYISDSRFSRNLSMIAGIEKDTAGGRDRIYTCDVASDRSTYITVPVDIVGQLKSLAISPDGTEITAWAQSEKTEPTLSRFDLGTGRFLGTIPQPGYAGFSYLDYSPDGEFLLFGDNMGHLTIHDIQKGKRVLDVKPGTGPICCLVILDDRIRVVSTVSHEEQVKLFGEGADHMSILRLTDVWVRLRP